MAAEGSKRTICIEGSKRSWRTHREAAEDVVVGVVVVRPDPVRARADAWGPRGFECEGGPHRAYIYRRLGNA